MSEPRSTPLDLDRYGDRGDALRRAILQLPKYERLVVTLHYFEELSDAEIARVLELDAGTVTTLRESALRRIREHSNRRPRLTRALT